MPGKIDTNINSEDESKIRKVKLDSENLSGDIQPLQKLDTENLNDDVQPLQKLDKENLNRDVPQVQKLDTENLNADDLSKVKEVSLDKQNVNPAVTPGDKDKLENINNDPIPPKGKLEGNVNDVPAEQGETSGTTISNAILGLKDLGNVNTDI